MTAPDQWRDNGDTLTISQAAAALGMGERRLRRLLEKPEYAVRTLSVTRQTKTGTRQSVSVPADLLADLKRLLEIETGAKNADTTSDSDNPGSIVEAKPGRTGGTMTRTEQVLSQLVVKQDAQIAALQKQVETLTETVRSQAETIAALTAHHISSEPERKALPPAPRSPLAIIWGMFRPKKGDDL